MTEPIADFATAIALGRRSRQEDAVLADFSDGAESGFAVLSDGMGGHDDGDLAARVIVAEVFGALSLSGRAETTDSATLRLRLRQAIQSANQSLRDQVNAGQGQEGMGGTVITAVLQNDALSWISIGDSGLYLLRDGQLCRLNEVHSLAPQIDLMVLQGEIDEETGRSHPQRSCLTSALVGAGIHRIDCPEQPLELRPDDILLMASDGLEVLPEAQLRDILWQNRNSSSQQIARALMQAVAQRDAPEQDNVSIIVIKPRLSRAECAQTNPSHAVGLPFLSPVRNGLSNLRQTLVALLTGRSAL